MHLDDLLPCTLADVSAVQGKRVLVRVDLNLPVADGKITDTTRLDVIIPFIKELSFAGAKTILLSHFGEKGESIEPVAKLLSEKLLSCSFVPGTDIVELQKKIAVMAPGDVVLLENTRCFQGETENTPSTARDFASLGDIFINDAFSASHREHASIVGIPNYLLSYFGPTCIQEIVSLSKALRPEKPALFIIGGAKISTKLKLIKHYTDQGVHVFVGGAMAHNLFKEKGYEIGDSFYDPTYKDTSLLTNNPFVLLPTDVLLSNGKEVSVQEVSRGDTIVDCGKETLATLDDLIQKAKTVIVNGPLGLYEKGWLYGTEHMLTSVARQHLAHTYIGGGDTLTVADKIHITKNIGYVSLGGGAMLDFLAEGTLPGIEAIITSHRG